MPLRSDHAKSQVAIRSICLGSETADGALLACLQTMLMLLSAQQDLLAKKQNMDSLA